MSNETLNPVLLHAYPSNDETPAFTIEIYWGSALGDDLNGNLVNPLKIMEWQGWFNEYMEKHDVKAEDLIEYGFEPSFICKNMNQQFEGKDVFTDHVERTEFLLKQVFATTKEWQMNFNLKSLNELLYEQLKRGENDVLRLVKS